ncbi:MAG TPA: DUF1328 domain-containing protein [Tepidisphaeraceae bacterium]|jgi:uncharacterized membrane protein YtjA (UPF0391 family)
MLAVITLGSLLLWAIIFFVVAMVAWAMGSAGVAGLSASVGRALLFIFLILAVIMLILNFTMVSVG